MKSFCGAADPQIDKAVRLLRQYEKTASDKYLNAKKPNARTPSQRPETSIREAKKYTEACQDTEESGLNSFSDNYDEDFHDEQLNTNQDANIDVVSTTLNSSLNL